MELHERSAYVVPPLDVTFDWRADIERFGRELAMAEERGTGDSLSLAEMECSLDLIDVMNGGAPVGPGQTTWSFPIPMVPALVGQSINWQNANIVIPTGEWSMSNGVEWWIGN